MPDLRPVEARDTPAIQQLLDRIFSEYGLTFDLPDFDADMQDPPASYPGGNKLLWVLADQDQVLGTVGVAIDEDQAELKRLYLAQEARGGGWGARMTQYAIDHARSAGCRQMVAWSDTLFVHAHALYKRLGFRQDGKRPLEDLNQSWEYGFWLDL